MTMTDTSRYAVTFVPVAEIYCDHEFNCRGRIIPGEVRDLADSIKDRGLEQPIHVQPYDKKQGKKYRIVSGHRRFTAVCQLQHPTIPAVIRNDLVDESSAREANLIENIQRTDLNIVKEAEAVSWFVVNGYSMNQVARKLGKTPGWVDVRRKLVALPAFVQKEAADGVIKQSHIQQLYQFRDNPEKLAELVRYIKERAEEGEKAIQIKQNLDIIQFAKVRRPKPHEIMDMLALIGAMITNKIDDDFYFPHKVLAWSAGNISLAEMYVALRKECTNRSLPFNPPEDVRQLLNGLSKTTTAN
jgi:ParB/RepB/Spo0J family partition protein